MTVRKTPGCIALILLASRRLLKMLIHLRAHLVLPATTVSFLLNRISSSPPMALAQCAVRTILNALLGAVSDSTCKFAERLPPRRRRLLPVPHQALALRQLPAWRMATFPGLVPLRKEASRSPNQASTLSNSIGSYVTCKLPIIVNHAIRQCQHLFIAPLQSFRANLNLTFGLTFWKQMYQFHLLSLFPAVNPILSHLSNLTELFSVIFHSITSSSNRQWITTCSFSKLCPFVDTQS